MPQARTLRRMKTCHTRRPEVGGRSLDAQATPRRSVSEWVEAAENRGEGVSERESWLANRSASPTESARLRQGYVGQPSP
jgi:hypothetical protein